jgi:hypothetical protein
MGKHSASYSGELFCELGSENIKIEDFVLILQYRYANAATGRPDTSQLLIIFPFTSLTYSTINSKKQSSRSQ